MKKRMKVKQLYLEKHFLNTVFASTANYSREESDLLSSPLPAAQSFWLLAQLSLFSCKQGTREPFFCLASKLETVNLLSLFSVAAFLISCNAQKKEKYHMAVGTD